MAQFYSAKRCVTTRQIIRVMIDELDGLGQGVGRINGKALFISGALPGECVEVEIVQEKVHGRGAKQPEFFLPALNAWHHAVRILAAVVAVRSSMHHPPCSSRAKLTPFRAC